MNYMRKFLRRDIPFSFSQREVFWLILGIKFNNETKNDSVGVSRDEAIVVLRQRASKPIEMLRLPVDTEHPAQTPKVTPIIIPTHAAPKPIVKEILVPYKILAK